MDKKRLLNLLITVWVFISLILSPGIGWVPNTYAAGPPQGKVSAQEEEAEPDKTLGVLPEKGKKTEVEGEAQSLEAQLGAVITAPIRLLEEILSVTSQEEAEKVKREVIEKELLEEAK